MDKEAVIRAAEALRKADAAVNDHDEKINKMDLELQRARVAKAEAVTARNNAADHLKRTVMAGNG